MLSPRDEPAPGATFLPLMPRPALHAWSLTIAHPLTGAILCIEAPTRTIWLWLSAICTTLDTQIDYVSSRRQARQ